MSKYKFRFYIGGKMKFERIYEAESLPHAWKMAHHEAANYPSKKHIEIANI